MKPEASLSCPTDFVLMNEYKARLIALHVLLVAIVIILFPHWTFMVLLTADFLLRAFNLGRYSPFAKTSDMLIRLSGIGSKPVDQAPKRFAARIGLTLSVAMLLSHVLNYALATAGLAGTLVIAEDFNAVRTVYKK